jgi:spore germination cell wall hydrolase CwlJ-like protein
MNIEQIRHLTVCISRSIILASLDQESLVSAKSDVLPKSRVAERSDRLYRLISPPVALLEESWRKGRERRQRISEHMCLARAIYFEARSESEIGRLAVAQVIMNRVKSPFYPDTICDVVYQNAERRNACQFSFTCDGESDNPRNGRAWKLAKSLASRAMAGEGEVQAIATATNYHADYVQPKWTGTMTRLVQIGRHIFYDGS